MIAMRIKQTEEYYKMKFPKDRLRNFELKESNRRFKLLMLNNNLTLVKYLRKKNDFYTIRIILKKEDKETDFWSFVYDYQKSRMYIVSFRIQATLKSYRKESKFNYGINPVNDLNGRIKGYELTNDDVNETYKKFKEYFSKKEEKKDKKFIIGFKHKIENGILFKMKREEEAFEIDITKETISDTCSTMKSETNKMIVDNMVLSTERYGINKTKQDKMDKIPADFVAFNQILERKKSFFRSNIGFRFFRTGNGSILRNRRDRNYSKSRDGNYKVTKKKNSKEKKIEEKSSKSNSIYEGKFSMRDRDGLSQTRTCFGKIKTLENEYGVFANKVRDSLEELEFKKELGFKNILKNKFKKKKNLKKPLNFKKRYYSFYEDFNEEEFYLGKR